MGIQLRNGAYQYIVDSHTNVGLSLFSSPEASFTLRRKLVTEKDRVSISRKFVSIGRGRRRRNRKGNVVEASNGVNVAPFWNDKASSAPCLSDVFWPSAGKNIYKITYTTVKVHVFFRKNNNVILCFSKSNICIF